MWEKFITELHKGSKTWLLPKRREHFVYFWCVGTDSLWFRLTVREVLIYFYSVFNFKISSLASRFLGMSKWNTNINVSRYLVLPKLATGRRRPCLAGLATDYRTKHVGGFVARPSVPTAAERLDDRWLVVSA